MLGAAALAGIDALTGQPTEVDGLTSAAANTDSRGNRVVAAPPADYVLGEDPPHDFNPVQEQLCGPGGDYPHVTNGGFISSAGHTLLDPTVVMRCFAPDQLPVLTTLAR